MSEQATIEQIRTNEGDSEKAHSLEDQALWRLAGYVHTGHFAEAKILADALIEYDLENPYRDRWCA